MSVEERLDKFKQYAIDKVISGLFFLTILAVPVSISRVGMTGWQTAYTVQIVCFFIFLVIFMRRNKLTVQLKVSMTIGLTFAVAIVGLLNYGILGNGMVWAIISLMLCMHFTDARTTSAAVAIFVVVYTLSMYRFIYGSSVFPIDANIYISSPSSWASAFFSSALFGVIIGNTIIGKQKLIINLLMQLEQQNHTIEVQKQKMEHNANYDLLTELPSLRLANERLDLAISLAKREGHQTALLFLDLDGFKVINDTYGHDAGDTFLKETASRILSVVRESDTACRIGGDEFIVILSKIKATEYVSTLCERLIETITSPVKFGDGDLIVGVSIGVAVYPDIAKDATSLRKKADEAMYKVKRSGKNNFIIAEE